MILKPSSTRTLVSRARRPLDRAYVALSILFVLALAAVLFAGVIQASPSVTHYGVGWSLADGQAGSLFEQHGNDSLLRGNGVHDEIGFERQLYALVNQTRIEHSLPPLKLSESLTRAARDHSRVMADSRRFDSAGLGGESVQQRAADAGFTRPQLVLESTGAGFADPAQTLGAILANSNSGANLLNQDVNEVGVGYAYSGTDRSFRHYWTIDLGRKSGLSFVVVVDNGAESTTSAQVTLYIGGKSWAREMQISNSSDFGGAAWQPFAETKTWELSEGTGPKEVHVKLQGPDGQEDVSTGHIALFAAAKGIKPGPPQNDAFLSPRAPILRYPAGEAPISGAVSPNPSAPAVIVPSSAGIAPGYYQTSEFMLGKVVVGVVMPQCDGAVDKCGEKWTTSAMDQVITQVKAGTNWWVKRLNGRVSFVFDQQRAVPTGYEPINHSQSDEGLWIKDVMTHLGFSGKTYFEQVYAYNNWMRQKYGTDWAFTIFVADSLNNGPGTFSNGYFSYSYVPGPFTVTTYDNDGYTINNMAAVIAHETGHIFGALDEYSGAKIACTAKSGYLSLPNENSQQNCASNVDSIMRGGLAPYVGNLIDSYALGMIGFRMTGNDGLPDPINTAPTVSLNRAATLSAQSKITLTGTAQDQPFMPPNGTGITINYITGVKYRVDAGPWQEARPADGSGKFDKISEGFSFSPQLTAGTHVIEVQAENRVGHLSAIARTTVTSDRVVADHARTVADVTQIPNPIPTRVPPTSPPDPTRTAHKDSILIPIQAGMTPISLGEAGYTASSLLSAINGQGGNATEILNWNGRTWEVYGVDGGGTDFQIQVGVGYIVQAQAASSFVVASIRGGEPILVESGWRVIGAPPCAGGAASCYTASQLAASINSKGGAVTEIDCWADGTWSAYRVGFPFDDFPIVAGQGYLVHSTRPVQWNP